MAATKAGGSQIPLSGDACKGYFIKILLLNLFLIRWGKTGWKTRILCCKKWCKYQLWILIPIPMIHIENVKSGWDEVLLQVSHWNKWIFQTFSDYFCSKHTFSLCIWGSTTSHCPLHCRVRTPGMGLPGSQSAWHFSNSNPFLLSQFGVCRTQTVPLVRGTGIKSTEKFLQLHLLQQFLIILPWNYKTSGTRANLPWKLCCLHLERKPDKG